MNYEVEQKFHVRDLDRLAADLGRLGARFQSVVVQRDYYFAHPARDFGQTDEALRIRCVDAENFVTYKGPKIDATTKTRREIELPLASGAAAADRFAELLKVLGFAPVAEVRKTRRPLTIRWQGWDVDGALDHVDGLGSFAELELRVDQCELERAKAAILSLAGQLGLAHTERRSYLALLLAQAHTDPDRA
ncbi:MAG: hypothetical protein A2W31_03705 [Planctomycetes bacterium RBG_16_64_10]|nr:MAG: hypothetical protein A2W31_03705 [Planctomycetes bacterium RBG_16_64_10]